jgi:hypothetical protein
MATSKVAQYGVDLYKIGVNPGGLIQINASTFSINGDLLVTGDTTSIEVSNLEVTDNVITVNKGETGSGVTLGTAGIAVNRGSLNDVLFLFDENKSFLDSATGTIRTGAFSLSSTDNTQVGLFTNSIKTTNNNDLYLLSEGTGVVSVTGTVNYEQQLWDYTGLDISFDISTTDRLVVPTDTDILVNVQALKDYVSSYHLYNFQQKISSPSPSGNTEVQVFDTDAGDPTSHATITVDGTTVFDANELTTAINTNLTVVGTLVLPVDLEVEYGGTGVSSFTSGGILYGNDVGPVQVTALAGNSDIRTSSQILTVNESSIPVWTDTIDAGLFDPTELESAPVSLNNLSAQSYTVTTGIQTVNTFTSFTGQGLFYTISPVISGLTFNNLTGVLQVSTVNLLSLTQITITAHNIIGSATSAFDLAIVI